MLNAAEFATFVRRPLWVDMFFEITTNGVEYLLVGRQADQTVLPGARSLLNLAGDFRGQ